MHESQEAVDEIQYEQNRQHGRPYHRQKCCILEAHGLSMMVVSVVGKQGSPTGGVENYNTPQN